MRWQPRLPPRGFASSHPVLMPAGEWRATTAQIDRMTKQIEDA